MGNHQIIRLVTAIRCRPEYVSAMAVDKENALIAWLTRHRRVAIGFSGGVDSAYLAAIAVEVLGTTHCLALIGRSPSLAGGDEDHAVTVARAVGIPTLEIDTGELADPRLATNPSKRCHFCMTFLWHTIVHV